jgi:uncharacterized phage infection (PIP) family protein YhgE
MEFHEEEKMRNVDNPGVSTAADRIADDIPSLTDKAKSDFAQAAETAKAEARRIASQQKAAGADRLGEVAGAVHGAARSLEAGMPQMASYVHDAAVRLEDAAKTLRQRNVDDLMSEIGRFARSQPALFFGGAMLAGFALTRFLRSSASNGSMPGASTSGFSTGGSGRRGAGSGMADAGWRQHETGGQR